MRGCIAALMLGFGLIPAACSKGEEEVAVDGIAYSPATLQVEAGTTITWTNEDEVAHTVTSGRQAEQGVPGVSSGADALPDGKFDGELDGEGRSFSYTFNEPGTFAYYCAIHVGMIGKVVVN